MSFRLGFGAVLAALSIPANLHAQAQTQAACMTEAEATALFSYALPEMLNTVANKCAKTLPASSFLASKGTALVASYRSSVATDWPLAKAAFLKSAGPDDSDGARILAEMPDDALKALVGTALNVVVGSDIKPANCPKIDSIVAALAPLPISNISSLLVSIMGLAGGKDEKFQICPKS